MNTSLGECWEDRGERVDEEKLFARREPYERAPANVVCITAGVDVQDDRLEIDRFGWTVTSQSYGLGKVVLFRDPTAPRVWNELDELLSTPIEHDLVGEMNISACSVDSGFLTQTVGEFCRDKWNRRIWAIKGMPGEGRPIFKRAPGKLKKTNLEFFLVGTDTVKDVLYSRLRIEDPTAPGYCHFNMSYDQNHFFQLTAEEVKIKYSKGRKSRQYELRPGRKRNEALDIFGYSLAALEGLKISGLNLRRKWEKMLEKNGERAKELIQVKQELQREADLPKMVKAPSKRKRRVIGRFG